MCLFWHTQAGAWHQYDSNDKSRTCESVGGIFVNQADIAFIQIGLIMENPTLLGRHCTHHKKEFVLFEP